MVSPRTTAPGAETVTTLPWPRPNQDRVGVALERDASLDAHRSVMRSFENDDIAVDRPVDDCLHVIVPGRHHHAAREGRHGVGGSQSRRPHQSAP